MVGETGSQVQTVVPECRWVLFFVKIIAIVFDVDVVHLFVMIIMIAIAIIACLPLKELPPVSRHQPKRDNNHKKKQPSAHLVVVIMMIIQDYLINADERMTAGLTPVAM